MSIRSTQLARDAGATNGSAKYCVSCATLSPLNSMMLTFYPHCAMGKAPGCDGFQERLPYAHPTQILGDHNRLKFADVKNLPRDSEPNRPRPCVATRAA